MIPASISVPSGPFRTRGARPRRGALASCQSSGHSIEATPGRSEAGEAVSRGGAAGETAGSGWEFLVKPYFQATNIDGESAIGRAGAASIGIDFSDILETLDAGFMGAFEVKHPSDWGLILDYAFMDLKNDGAGPAGAIIDARVRQGALDALVFKRFDTRQGTVDIFGGVRWWDIDLDVERAPIVPPGPNISRGRSIDWVDPLIGARWSRALAEDWSVVARGDIGGFGVSSDFAWTAALAGYYHINKTISFELMYKAVGVDYEEGSAGSADHFIYDTISHGPILGIAIAF